MLSTISRFMLIHQRALGSAEGRLHDSGKLNIRCDCKDLTHCLRIRVKMEVMRTSETLLHGVTTWRPRLESSPPLEPQDVATLLTV